MTSIEKLLIQGVRSFSPQNRAIIEFFKPLTLIVGHNGAGKTTIIECLKYACTGDMPPDSKKGQAFLHDPKLAGEREIKAQIKLRFQSVTGKPIVATRCLQLTQKANKQECKSIDSSLQTIDAKGNKISQSYRCADLDKEVPELMGVSKAILENVIFCHQEESNWPLGDAATLKKRFDDIFASTRYTKALELIKKQRKEYGAEIKELKLKLEHLQTIKDNVNKIKKEIADTEGKVGVVDKEIAKLKGRIQEKEAKKNELQGVYDKFKELLEEIRQETTKKDEKAKQLAQLKSSLTEEYQVDDEQLSRMYAEYAQQSGSMDKNKKRIVDEIDVLNEEKEEFENQRTKLAVEFGELRKSMEQLKSQKESRDKHIVAFAKTYKIDDFTELPFDDDKALAFIAKASKMLERVKEKIREFKTKHQTDVEALNGELDQLRKKQSDLQSELDSKKKKVVDNKNEMQQLDQAIKTKKAMYDQLDSLEARLTSEKNALEAARSQFDEAAFKEILKGLETKRDESTKNMRELNELIKVLNSQSSLSAKVDHLRQEKTKYETEFNKTLKSIEGQLVELLGEIVAPEQLKSVVEAKSRTARQELAQAKSNQSKSSSRSSQLSGQITFAEEQVKELTKQLKEKQSKLKDVPEGTNLPDMIRQYEEKINKLKKDLASTKALEMTFLSFIDQAQKTHQCPLCTTDFGHGVSDLVNKLQTVITDIPSKVGDLESNVLAAINEKQKLEGLVEHWNRAQALEGELSALNEKHNSLKAELQDIESTLQQLNGVVEEKTKRLEELTKLLPISDQLTNQMKKIAETVSDLESQEQKLASFDSSGRSLTDVSNQMQQEQTTQNELSKELERQRQEFQNGKDKIHALERQVSDLEKEVLQLRGVNDRIVVLKQKYDELVQQSREIEPLLHTLSEQLEEARKNVAEVTTKRDELIKSASGKEEKHQKDKEAFTAKLIELQGMQNMVSKIKPEELEKRGRHVTEEKEQIEAKLSDIAQKIKEKQDEVQHIVNQLNNRDQYKRTLEDNIRYREDKKTLSALEAKIFKMREARQSSNSEGVIEEIETLTAQIDESKSKLNQLLGSRNAYLEQIKAKNVDLKKPENNSAEDEYRRMLIKYKTTDMASADLDKYYKALDKALMKFHSMKMFEINKIIKELWVTTYKGNDIQTIEIRADQEENNGKRNYNYRLVMIKGETELDMRGRCSAGQKVLASLVIRLALAETFCLNCGILALDEPTTNLDRYNVESFAGALVNIIENRKQQRNFQLIIITHDEEFVQLLGRSEHADHYWRVSKDQKYVFGDDKNRSDLEKITYRKLFVYRYYGY